MQCSDVVTGQLYSDFAGRSCSGGPQAAVADSLIVSVQPVHQRFQQLEMVTGTLASKLRCTSLASLDEFHWHFLSTSAGCAVHQSNQNNIQWYSVDLPVLSCTHGSKAHGILHRSEMRKIN